LLGDPQAEPLAKLAELLPELEQTHSPIATDNKLDRHEWLCLPDGRLLKTDALEHGHAHDAIGAQDPAWDVAGAVVELGLSHDEREALLARLRNQAHRTFTHRKLRFYEIAYAAFRAAHAALAVESLHAWPEDAQRMSRSSEAYVTALRERAAS
jgi:hypothetical protein